MSSRSIKILRVEDETSQRRLVAHHLTTIASFRVEILYADAEEGALDLFDTGGVEFVILDYRLRQGNGLHCLEELRRRDPIVPIIAISGIATPEIAANLLQAGADDYISKRELTGGELARSMHAAVARADEWRLRNVGLRRQDFFRA